MARPLHKALSHAGVNAWLDESEIRLGQSIRQKIDEGLANCRSATVILSRPFFSKSWTQYELDGIVGRKMQGEILLFPIQHGITVEEIRNHSPSLAGLSLWNSSNHSPEKIAAEIASQLEVAKSAAAVTTTEHTSRQSATAERARTAPTFGKFYIAPKGTPELPENSEPKVDAFLFLANPRDVEGWTPVLHNQEELEYVLERGTLRLRLSWGNGSRLHLLRGGIHDSPNAQRKRSICPFDTKDRRPANLSTLGSQYLAGKRIDGNNQPVRMDDLPDRIDPSTEIGTTKPKAQEISLPVLPPHGPVHEGTNPQHLQTYQQTMPVNYVNVNRR